MTIKRFIVKRGRNVDAGTVHEIPLTLQNEFGGKLSLRILGIGAPLESIAECIPDVLKPREKGGK